MSDRRDVTCGWKKRKGLFREKYSSAEKHTGVRIEVPEINYIIYKFSRIIFLDFYLATDGCARGVRLYDRYRVSGRSRNRFHGFFDTSIRLFVREVRAVETDSRGDSRMFQRGHDGRGGKQDFVRDERGLELLVESVEGVAHTVVERGSESRAHLTVGHHLVEYGLAGFFGKRESGQVSEDVPGGIERTSDPIRLQLVQHEVRELLADSLDGDDASGEFLHAVEGFEGGHCEVLHFDRWVTG